MLLRCVCDNAGLLISAWTLGELAVPMFALDAFTCISWAFSNKMLTCHMVLCRIPNELLKS